jgi:hypothetical protein
MTSTIVGRHGWRLCAGAPQPATQSPDILFERGIETNLSARAKTTGAPCRGF